MKNKKEIISNKGLEKFSEIHPWTWWQSLDKRKHVNVINNYWFSTVMTLHVCKFNIILYVCVSYYTPILSHNHFTNALSWIETTPEPQQWSTSTDTSSICLHLVASADVVGGCSRWRSMASDDVRWCLMTLDEAIVFMPSCRCRGRVKKKNSGLG